MHTTLRLVHMLFIRETKSISQKLLEDEGSV